VPAGGLVAHPVRGSDGRSASGAGAGEQQPGQGLGRDTGAIGWSPHRVFNCPPWLPVQVYAGLDGSFTLVEDDGASLDYQGQDPAATRRTAWAWDDSSRLLTWTVTGSFASGPNLFTSATVSLFVANATSVVVKGPVALGSSGSLQF
jgi:hypothetical protein